MQGPVLWLGGGGIEPEERARVSIRGVGRHPLV